MHAQPVGSAEPPAQVVYVFSIEYLSFSIYYLLEEVFNHMYIVDAQDAGASPPGSAPHLQWGQVGKIDKHIIPYAERGWLLSHPP